jgi:hypothetical protein
VNLELNLSKNFQQKFKSLINDLTFGKGLATTNKKGNVRYSRDGKHIMHDGPLLAFNPERAMKDVTDGIRDLFKKVPKVMPDETTNLFSKPHMWASRIFNPIGHLIADTNQKNLAGVAQGSPISPILSLTAMDV